MLDHLRQRVIEAMLPINSVSLATYGPAGLQAGQYPCESVGLQLFIILPVTSDHLLNLENRPDVVASTSTWQMRGLAVILDKAASPPELHLLDDISKAQWNHLLEINPTQFNIRRDDGLGFSETIDIDIE